MPPYGPKPDHKRRRLIAELRAKGFSYGAIAERLGVTKQDVFSLLNRPQRHSAREAKCKVCNAVIVRGAVAGRTAQNTFCLPCLAKHPEAPFSERLKAYRVTAGLTRTELAERSGVRVANIAYYEKDPSVDPSWSKVLQMAQVLGVGLLGLERLTGGNGK